MKAAEFKQLVIDDPDSAFSYAKDCFAPAVGHLVFSFGELEKAVDLKLSSLIDIHDDEAEMIWTQINSMVAKTKLIEKIVNKRDSTKSAQIADFCRRTGRVNKLRNVIVHGPWSTFFTSKDTILWQKTWLNRQNGRREFQDISVDIIMESVDECRELLVNLHEATEGLS